MGKDKLTGTPIGKAGQRIAYERPRILSVTVAPDITKSMQNTGGTVPRSTFRNYRSQEAGIGRT